MVLSETINAVLDSNFERIARDTPLLELLFGLRANAVFNNEEIKNLRECESLKARHRQFIQLFKTKSDADFRHFCILLQNHKSKNVQRFGLRLEAEAIEAFNATASKIPVLQTLMIITLVVVL